MYIPDKISIRRMIAFDLKTFSVLFFIYFFTAQHLLAQIAEDFQDGDFTTNPVWNGSTSNFFINGSSQLQLNNSVAGSSYLSTSFISPVIDDYEWEWYVKQSFAPSGANFGRFYLISDQPDLSAALNGYYLQFGEAGSNDAVELFRQSGTSSISVCRATTARIATAFEIRVKVRRDASGLWQLYIDYTGGRNFDLEAYGTDLTYTTSAFAGIFCTYTVTNATRFYFDDINIRPGSLPDKTLPEIISLNIVSDRELNIVFSEDVNAITAENTANYFLSEPDERPAYAVLQADQKTIQLIFPGSFLNGSMNTLTILDLEDLHGNKMVMKQIDFRYFIPNPISFRDIIISEVFPDPSPQVGLPSAEFVELYNRSANPIDVGGWHFTDGSSTGLLPSFILLPGKFLILSASSAMAEFAPYGETLSLSSFPALNNAADRLGLMDGDGSVIDSVNYSASWYKDGDKEAGGWTLERIDPENACDEGENWMASKDVSGGTPGRMNSVHQITPDIKGPHLMQAVQLDGTILQLVFDEKLNASLPVSADFIVLPPSSILSVSFADVSREVLNLELSNPIDTAITYSISAANIFDCPGNIIAPGYDKAYLNRDLIPPLILSLQAETANSLTVTFSEKVSASSQSISNYSIQMTGYPESVTLRDDQRSVTLHYAQPFENGNSFVITIKDVADLSGNVIATIEKNFLFFEYSPAYFKDVIITELFSDPAPPVGLPEAEFVELYNRSKKPFDLSGWTISDRSNSGKLPAYILLPGKYLTVTTPSTRTEFLSFGEVISATPFPSLNNSEDLIIIKDATGLPVDSIHYNLSWYQDEEKAEGGWSVELIDPENLCEAEANWLASESEKGGTPGKPNSVYATKPDNKGPTLQSVTALNPNTLLVAFDERLENVIPAIEQFMIGPPLKVNSIAFADASLSTFLLSLSEPIHHSTKYTLTVFDLYDCPGNRIETNSSSQTFILPEDGVPGDIIVNEILFNPRPTGVDFVEIYNRSEKTINLKHWKMAQSNDGNIENAETISAQNLLIGPKEYKVFTEDPNVLKGEYLQAVEDSFVKMDLPAFNDEAGSVALVNERDSIMDAFLYMDKMHGLFIKNDEGVSLERISVAWPAGENENWRSASSSVGFATPGYVNSNLRADVFLDDGSVIVEPEILRPMVNNQDFAQIRFRFDRGGFVANVKIYDQQGRTVKELAHNALLGTEGFFRWDGDLDNGSMARMGYYLVWFEVFDAEGMLKTFKKRVAVY